MNEISIKMFICLITPLSFMLLIFRKESRIIFSFLLFGITSCLLAGFVNEFVANLVNIDRNSLTVNITPIIEESLKAIPIIIFGFVFKPKKERLLECSMTVGIGFSILENFCVMYFANVSYLLAFVRGIGTSLMHGVCTLIIGCAIHNIISKKEIFILGTFSSLATAIIYHSIFNILIQSSYPILGLVMPVLSYIPLIIIFKSKIKEAVKN